MQATSVLGERIARARKGRGWTQQDLAGKVGIDQTRLSQIELGKGGGVPADVWFAIADALAMPFRIEFGRDPAQGLEDAGHLDMQELMLRLGGSTGFSRTFELATKPASPGYSTDVGLRDDRRRLLVLEECWNTFGNLGASVRSTRRKIAEAEAFSIALGGAGGAYRVAAVWVVRDVQRNRDVLARYPQVFDATFTASSSSWVKALTSPAADPPSELGLVWCDPRRGLVTAWRRR